MGRGDGIADYFCKLLSIQTKRKKLIQCVSSRKIDEDFNTKNVRKFCAELVGTQQNKTTPMMSTWVGLGWFTICLASEF